MSKSEYQPEKGTEDYVHVRVTEKQGQKLAEPQIEQYHPNAWTGVSKLVGFVGEVVHDPRTAAQKAAAAPAAGQVKTTEKLETPEQYRQRYKELFREEAPYNMEFTSLKLTVDRAEAKLADTSNAKPIDETTTLGDVATHLGIAKSDVPGFIEALQKAASAPKGADADDDEDEDEEDGEDKLPTSKKGWYELFQKTFPDDTTAYDDITEKAIRERLGK